MTLRTRLTVWYVFTLAGLLALTAIGLFYALNRVAQKRFDTALWMLGASEAEGIASNVRQRGIPRPDDQTVNDSPRRELLGFEHGPNEKYVMVVDDTGRIADASANLPTPLRLNRELFDRAMAGEVVYETVTGTPESGKLRVVYMPVRGAAVPHPFVALVGLREAIVSGEVNNLDLIIGLALATIVLLTGASALFLTERSIKPLEEITTAAESINSLNLSTRLPVPRMHDQIGRLTRVINQMLGRLDAAFDAQRSFTARAAHELRTPLTILKGETQVALRRERTTSEYQGLLKSNMEEIEAMVVMIDDLLMLARYEGGETELPREPVQLSEVVKSVLASLQPIATDKGIDLQIKTEELALYGDQNALERLVSNLIVNALFYTPRQGRVSVLAERAGQCATLIVADNGVGIDQAELPHVFNRFYRSAGTRMMHPEGSGIGLAVAAAITHLHGGEITVTSDQHQGARFVVSLPLSTSI
ncbi:MAG: ATP-binding protein [Acidobacteriota bacterium]|nr:ATP-binding protein [Acidobacteriota bacterium]